LTGPGCAVNCEWKPKVIAMSNTIRVPLNSPAFHSYVHEGWRLIHITGLWATLRYDEDGKSSAHSASTKPARADEHRERKAG